MGGLGRSCWRWRVWGSGSPVRWNNYLPGMGLQPMIRKTAINAIWRLTLASFAFVQIIGAIVLVSVIIEGGAPGHQIAGAYLIFLVFSAFVFLAAQRIRRMVRKMYE